MTHGLFFFFPITLNVLVTIHCNWHGVLICDRDVHSEHVWYMHVQVELLYPQCSWCFMGRGVGTALIILRQFMSLSHGSGYDAISIPPRQHVEQLWASPNLLAAVIFKPYCHLFPTYRAVQSSVLVSSTSLVLASPRYSLRED